MASKWEQGVDEAALITLGGKLIICGRSVSCWDEEVRQLVEDRRASFTQGLDNESNWSDYLSIRKELKQQIREKRKFIEKNYQFKLITTIQRTLRLTGNLLMGRLSLVLRMGLKH